MTNSPFGNVSSLFDLLGGIGDYAGRNVPGYEPYGYSSTTTNPAKDDGPKYKLVSELSVGTVVVSPQGEELTVSHLAFVDGDPDSLEVGFAEDAKDTQYLWKNTKVEVK